MDQTVPAYATEVADYGRSRDPEPGEGALVKNVRLESPAWDVGIEPGMRVLTVNGEQLTHMTQSAVKSHNGPADRLQSVGGACR